MIKTFILSCICKLGTKTQYNRYGYRRWIRAVCSDLIKNDNYTIKEKKFAYKHGFLPHTIESCNIDNDNYFKYISQRDFLQIVYFAKRKTRWLRNAMIHKDVYEHLSHYYPKSSIYCKKINGNFSFYSFDTPGKKQKGEVLLNLTNSEYVNILDITSGKLQCNIPVNDNNVVDAITNHMKKNKAIISTEKINDDESILVYAYKEAGYEACVGSILKREKCEDGKHKIVENIRQSDANNGELAKAFQKIETDVCQFLNKKNRVPLVAFEFKVVENSVILVKIMRKPPFPEYCTFDTAFNKYLNRLAKRAILSYRVRKRAKVVKKVSHLILNFRELRLVGQGFTPRNAKKWILKKYVDSKLMCSEGKAKLRWAHKHGFTLHTMKWQQINKKNYKQFVSEKQYLGVMPLNLKYQKWFSSMTNYYYMFKPFKKYFPDFIYHVVRRDGEQIFIPMGETNPDAEDYSELLYHIKHKESIEVRNAKGSLLYTFAYHDGNYYQGEREVDFPYIERIIKKIKGEFLILSNRFHESSRNSKSNYKIGIFVYNETGKNPEIGRAYIEIKEVGGWTKQNIELSNGRYKQNGQEKNVVQWDNITEFIDNFCRFIPQIKFFEMDLTANNNGFIVEKLLNYPEYTDLHPISSGMNAYLQKSSAEKAIYYRKFINRHSRMFDVVKRRIRKKFASILYPPGMVPYLSITWIRDVLLDMVTNKDCSMKEKLWAYKHGFFAYRIEQYGITEDNWERFISDFEYKWLRHINPYYKAWLEDKLSLKYIAQEYKSFFPEYYFHIICKNGECNIIPLLDCPQGYLPEFVDIIKLIKKKRVLP